MCTSSKSQIATVTRVGWRSRAPKAHASRLTRVRVDAGADDHHAWTAPPRAAERASRLTAAFDVKLARARLTRASCAAETAREATLAAALTVEGAGDGACAVRQP